MKKLCTQLRGDQDLRNHGDSPHSNTHNYNAMATDIEEFINVHNLQEPGLIGHSMLVRKLENPKHD